MTAISRKPQSLPEVLDLYVECLRQYLLAQRERRFVDGNKFVDAAREAATLLRHNFGPEGRKAMVTLLDHPDSGIRLGAASDVLDFAESRAVKVLNEIEKADQPFEGTAAHYCLREWQANRKSFPGGHIVLEANEKYD